MDGALMGDNDDYDPGSGNFASTVCFLAPSSGVPTVKITNLDQFGPTKNYTVTVVEEPFIETDPDSLTFTGTGVQTLNVAVPGGGNLFWMASENGAWLDIGPATGKTPSTMNVIVTTALPTGYYAATITIVPVGAPCDSSMPRTVPVNLVISPSASSRPEGMASLMPGLAGLAHRPRMMYERTGIFLPIYWKEWDGLRRFRP